SCTGRCGQNLNSAYTCQCNSHCVSYGDCCHDYAAKCLGETCEGRCDANHDSTKSCQCNSHCKTYNDCCPDYDQLCGSTDNRITRITVNYQGKTTTSGTSDAASSKFFTSVDETVFLNQTKTYYKFIALLNNYNPYIGQSEYISAEEQAEINSFLDAVMQTEVMSLAYDYLLTNDSSGFEHVLVGEQKSTVSGFHNWIQFYIEEKNNRLNYYGYISSKEPDVIAAKFEWNGKMKTKGSFFIGVSPEFDIAIYTLCAMTNPNSICSFMIQGQTILIQTWDINHKSGLQIDSAYPIL
ncbi:hypothetical protein KUTeg_000518, partial [Tegillarca granosa]